ncbi:MAG: glycosyltransferase, partial [bacterium]
MSNGSPLRVLLLIKGLGLGGAERLLERSIPHLDRRAFAYSMCYLLPWKDALVGAFETAGIPVHCLNVRYAVDPGALSRLIALARRGRIDVIHAHLPVPGVLARLARRRAGVRLVYTEHGIPSRSHIVTRLANAMTYRMNDAVIAVSDEVARRVRPYIRGERPPLVTIPNAIDPALFAHQAISRDRLCSEFGFPEDAQVIVNVGNLRAVKGHRHLLAAARRVIDREPRARFLLVGIGPLAGRLAQEARRLGLNGQVVFTGFRPDAASLIGSSDLFVLSSV